MTSRYAHAKQFKRCHRQLRLLRGRLGRIIRDIRRKITGRPELEAVFEAPIASAAQIRSQQQRQRGWKLYSFHAPRSIASSMKGCGSPGCRRAFRVTPGRTRSEHNESALPRNIRRKSKVPRGPRRPEVPAVRLGHSPGRIAIGGLQKNCDKR